MLKGDEPPEYSERRSHRQAQPAFSGGTIAPIRRKFTVTVEVNSEELPPPYDEAPTVARKAALLDEEESEDEDEESEDEEAAERDLDF